MCLLVLAPICNMLTCTVVVVLKLFLLVLTCPVLSVSARSGCEVSTLGSSVGLWTTYS